MQQKILLLFWLISQSLVEALQFQHDRRQERQSSNIVGNDHYLKGLHRRTPTKKPASATGNKSSSDRKATALERPGSGGQPRQRARKEAPPSGPAAAGQSLARQGSSGEAQGIGTRSKKATKPQADPTTTKSSPSRKRGRPQAQDAAIPSPRKIVGAKTLVRMKNKEPFPAFESMDQRLTRSASKQLATGGQTPEAPPKVQVPQRQTRSQSKQKNAGVEMPVTPPAAEVNRAVTRSQKGIAVKRVPVHVADAITENMAVPDRSNRIQSDGKILPGYTRVTPKRVAALRNSRPADGREEGTAENNLTFSD